MTRNPRVVELLLEWDSSCKHGREISVEELCRDDPELVEELRGRIELWRSQRESSKPAGDSTATTGPAPPVSGAGVLLQSGLEPVAGYRLMERLGRGGFGEVWRAIGPGNFTVAMKFVVLGEDAGPVELRSLELMKEVRHANLLALLGAWQKDGFLIVVMELADRTLLDRLREAMREGLEGIPFPELIEYMYEAAKALDFLNESRHLLDTGERVSIQHRDIKPQNLLLVGGSVKVADFGLARLLQKTVTSHTGSMTPAYAPPEFFSGEVHRQSDQYSLAVTYCHLRGGRLPFDGNAAQLLAGHLTKAPNLDMLPKAERAPTGRALSKQSAERWPTCRAFVDALRAAHADAPTPAVAVPSTVREAGTTPDSTSSSIAPVPARSWHDDRPRSRRRWIGVCILLGLLLVGGYALWPPAPSPELADDATADPSPELAADVPPDPRPEPVADKTTPTPKPVDTAPVPPKKTDSPTAAVTPTPAPKKPVVPSKTEPTPAPTGKGTSQPLPPASTITPSTPPKPEAKPVQRRTWLHLLVVSVEKTDEEKLVERACAALQVNKDKQPLEAPGYAQVRIYGPVGEAARDSLFTQLVLISKSIPIIAEDARWRRDEHKVLVYFEGQEVTLPEGRFLLTHASKTDPDPKRSGISVNELLNFGLKAPVPFRLEIKRAPVVVAALKSKSGQPHVVLVGINDYADSQIKRRDRAEEDARALYDLFTHKDYLGVPVGNVRLLLGQADPKRPNESATRANILKALRWAVSDTGPDTSLIVALFMQGAPLGERTCYLAVDSTFRERDSTAIAAADIEKELTAVKAHQLCVFLDVNFLGFDNNATAPELNRQALYREFDDGEQRGPRRVVYLAGLGTRPSLEATQNGLFTKVLLDGLRGEADREGYEPDGLVTSRELEVYLEREVTAAAQQTGKTAEEKAQRSYTLGSPGRSVLTYNPAVMPKVRQRLAAITRLAQETKLTAAIAAEGRELLGQMPTVKAQQELRREYQRLTDGASDVSDFLQNRGHILEGMKLKRSTALSFARKVITATEQVRESFLREVNQAELVGWAIRGLCEGIDEKPPQDIHDRLAKDRDVSEAELTSLLADVRERLGQREDLDGHKDIDLALQYLLTQLDPDATYIAPDSVPQVHETTDNFTGIGVQIRKDTSDRLIVVTPMMGGPAYKAGIKTGDIITQITGGVDGNSNRLTPQEVIATKGLPLNDAVQKILGKAGTKVRLTIERKGVNKPLEVEVTRAQVVVESVLGFRRNDDDSWDHMIDPEKRIAYVRLTNFTESTPRDLKEVIARLDELKINALVLDLRFNPGGLLTSAVSIADMFIDDGLIVTVRSRVAKEQSYRGESAGSYLNFPMACMVNRGSARVSEVLAATLQDHGRAVIMGERTFGKASIQNIYNFDGGRIKLTTASFWRPSGRNLDRSFTTGKEEDDWGVLPDPRFILNLSAKENEDLADRLHQLEIIPRRDMPLRGDQYVDRQLEMSLEHLRGQIRRSKK